MGQIKKGLPVISQKGNHPTLLKQEVKNSKYLLRAAVGDFIAWSPTAVCGLKLRYGRADGIPRFLQSMVIDVIL